MINVFDEREEVCEDVVITSLTDKRTRIQILDCDVNICFEEKL